MKRFWRELAYNSLEFSQEHLVLVKKNLETDRSAVQYKLYYIRLTLSIRNFYDWNIFYETASLSLLQLLILHYKPSYLPYHICLAETLIPR